MGASRGTCQRYETLRNYPKDGNVGALVGARVTAHRQNDLGQHHRGNLF